MSNGMVPYDESKLAITPEMRADAAAAAGSLEGGGGGPYLYLVQADATAVTERNEGKGGDWLVSGVGETPVNVGQHPLVIVLSQHVRFRYETKDNEGNLKLVWDVARDTMTDAQAAQADLDWKDPKAAKPYNAYMLLHVGDDGVIDPHKIGPFRYRATALGAKDSKKWVDDLGNAAAKGLPPFACVWELGSVLTDTGYKSKKLAMTHKLNATLPSSHPDYVKLRESWQAAQVAKKQQKATPHTPALSHSSQYDEDAEAERRAIEEADAEAAKHFAEQAAVHREEVKPATVVAKPEGIDPATMVTIRVQDGKKVQRRLGTMDVDELHRALQYHKDLQVAPSSVHYAPLQAIIGELEARLEDKGGDDDSSEIPF
ncbi:MAG: hypothetical protein IPP14_15635 [Planctomycetes bacterium]|nr:hypothetical protein [Planctomycetota bacterium]